MIFQLLSRASEIYTFTSFIGILLRSHFQTLVFVLHRLVLNAVLYLTLLFGQL